jgi:hypothetical protein
MTLFAAPNNAGDWTTPSCALVFTIEALLFVSRLHRRLHTLQKSFQRGCFVCCRSDTTFAVTKTMPVADQHVLAPSSQPSMPLYSFTDRTNNWLGFGNCTLSSALFAAFTIWLPLWLQISWVRIHTLLRLRSRCCREYTSSQTVAIVSPTKIDNPSLSTFPLPPR